MNIYFGTVEIKLGANKVEEATENLTKFYDLMIKKPIFMCIIVGKGNAIIHDEEKDIYIVPITTLKP